MKVTEVAKEWGISTRTIYRMIRADIIPVYSDIASRPIMCFHVDKQLVEKVKRLLAGKEVNPDVIRTIIQEISR